MRHESFNALERSQGGVESRQDAPRGKSVFHERDAVPEAHNKHGDDPEGNVAHLHRIAPRLNHVVFCRLSQGLHVLPQLVLVAVEDLDDVDGRD